MENIEKLNEAVQAVNDAVKRIAKANIGELNEIQYKVRQTLNAMLLLETKAFQDIERLATQRRAALQQEGTQRRVVVSEPVEAEPVAVEEKPAKKAKKAKKSGK